MRRLRRPLGWALSGFRGLPAVVNVQLHLTPPAPNPANRLWRVAVAGTSTAPSPRSSPSFRPCVSLPGGRRLHVLFPLDTGCYLLKELKTSKGRLSTWTYIHLLLAPLYASWLPSAFPAT